MRNNFAKDQSRAIILTSRLHFIFVPLFLFHFVELQAFVEIYAQHKRCL